MKDLLVPNLNQKLPAAVTLGRSEPGGSQSSLPNPPGKILPFPRKVAEAPAGAPSHSLNSPQRRGYRTAPAGFSFWGALWRWAVVAGLWAPFFLILRWGNG